MGAEVLIIGDNHTDCLAWGCERLGVGFHHIRSSSGAWYEGKYGFEDGRGLTAQPGPPRKKLNAIRVALGYENIFDAGLPVVASFGFNLGMLMSGISAAGHRVMAAGKGTGPVMSRAFSQKYVEANNGANFAILEQMAAVAPVTMVVPPRADRDPNRLQFVEMISDRMMALGAGVFDPSVMITQDAAKPLDRSWLREDGTYGTADYGVRAIKALLDHAVIERAAVAA